MVHPEVNRMTLRSEPEKMVIVKQTTVTSHSGYEPQRFKFIGCLHFALFFFYQISLISSHSHVSILPITTTKLLVKDSDLNPETGIVAQYNTFINKKHLF